MKTTNTPNTIKNLAIVTFLADIPAQLNLIKQYQSVLNEAWGNMRDQSGTHLIEAITFSTTKEHALKDYVEKASGLIFSSMGGWQRGYTTNRIAAQHTEVGQFIGMMNSKIETKDSVFVETMVRLFGYDRHLVNAAVATDPDIASKLVVNYLTERFELVATDLNNPEAHLSVFDGFYPLNLVQELTKDAGAIIGRSIPSADEDSFKFFRNVLSTLTPIKG